MSPSRLRVRGIFRGIIERIAQPLVKAGVSPDTITYLTVLISVFAFVILILGLPQPVYGVLVFLTGLFDGVDGAMARENQKMSDIGAFTDSVVDRISDVILLLPIAIVHHNETLLSLPIPIWVLLCLSGWLLTSYTRARAESLGVQDLDVGIAARSERLLILVIFSLMSMLLWGLIVVCALGVITAGYRILHYKKQLLEMEKLA